MRLILRELIKIKNRIVWSWNGFYHVAKTEGSLWQWIIANIISCPSCARQGFNVIETVKILEDRLAHVKTPMSLSIIGCVVNGPGEALMTDIGFTGGGAGNGMIYWAGKQDHRIGNDAMGDHFVDLVEKRAKEIDAEKIQEAAE